MRPYRPAIKANRPAMICSISTCTLIILFLIFSRALSPWNPVDHFQKDVRYNHRAAKLVMNKLNRGFSRLRDSEPDNKAETIVNSLTGNAAFPSPVPTLTVITSAITDFKADGDAGNTQSRENRQCASHLIGRLLLRSICLISHCKIWQCLNPARRSSLMKYLYRTLFSAIATVASLLIFNLPAIDAQEVWVGGGATQNWSDGNNWQSGTPPVSDQDIVFQGTNNLMPNQDFFPSFPVDSVTFAATGGGNTNAGALTWLVLPSASMFPVHPIRLKILRPILRHST